MTSVGVGGTVVVKHMAIGDCSERDTHVKPFCASLDHSLAFCGEAAKIGGKHGGGDDGTRHGASGTKKRFGGRSHYNLSWHEYLGSTTVAYFGQHIGPLIDSLV
jgi:hypothetical protein